jgi:hypothetical protein
VGQRIGYYGTSRRVGTIRRSQFIPFHSQHILHSQFIFNLANYQWAQGQQHVQAIHNICSQS